MEPTAWGHLSPYPESNRVVMARSAHHWIPEIEARLVELELDTVLAPTVADLADSMGTSIEQAITGLAACLHRT